MMYLGSLGRMVAIKCPTTQRVTPAGRYSFTTTMGGAVKAQVGPVGRRTWEVSLGKLSTPADVGTLMEFTQGTWGVGPFWFVPTDAPVVNMLTPAAAQFAASTIELFHGVEVLGYPPVYLGDDGVAARGLWKTTNGMAGIGVPVPVLAGEHVTASAWVIGGGYVRLAFLDSTGTQVSGLNSPTPGSSTPRRLAVTARAPDNAVSARLWVTDGVQQAARPAITWTDAPYEWGDGQGCEKAVVHSPTRDVIKAWRDQNTGRWSELSFTVQEVG